MFLQTGVASCRWWRLYSSCSVTTNNTRWLQNKCKRRTRRLSSQNSGWKCSWTRNPWVATFPRSLRRPRLMLLHSVNRQLCHPLRSCKNWFIKSYLFSAIKMKVCATVSPNTELFYSWRQHCCCCWWLVVFATRHVLKEPQMLRLFRYNDDFVFEISTEHWVCIDWTAMEHYILHACLWLTKRHRPSPCLLLHPCCPSTPSVLLTPNYRSLSSREVYNFQLCVFCVPLDVFAKRYFFNWSISIFTLYLYLNQTRFLSLLHS